MCVVVGDNISSVNRRLADDVRLYRTVDKTHSIGIRCLAVERQVHGSTISTRYLAPLLVFVNQILTHTQMQIRVNVCIGAFLKLYIYTQIYPFCS